MPGRSLNLCEKGMAAVLSGELLPGELVGVEMKLPVLSDPLRTRGQVRYQENLRCGLEFVGLSAAQRSAIKDCTKKLRAESEGAIASAAPIENAAGKPRVSGKTPPAKQKSRRNYRAAAWNIMGILFSFAAGVFWWKFQPYRINGEPAVVETTLAIEFKR